MINNKLFELVKDYLYLSYEKWDIKKIYFSYEWDTRKIDHENTKDIIYDFYYDIYGKIFADSDDDILICTIKGDKFIIHDYKLYDNINDIFAISEVEINLYIKKFIVETFEVGYGINDYQIMFPNRSKRD